MLAVLAMTIDLCHSQVITNKTRDTVRGHAIFFDIDGNALNVPAISVITNYSNFSYGTIDPNPTYVEQNRMDYSKGEGTFHQIVPRNGTEVINYKGEMWVRLNDKKFYYFIRESELQDLIEIKNK